MSAARLEIIKDDGEPIHVCRSMPAALERLVSRERFCDFCDKIDSSLQPLDEAHKRCKQRFWWKYGAVLFWICFFSFGLMHMIDSVLLYVVGYLVLLLVILSCIDCFVNFDVPRGALTEKELMRQMRRDCEDMSLSTPQVSFNIVLQPIPPFQMNFLPLEVVDIISLPCKGHLLTTHTMHLSYERKQ